MRTNSGKQKGFSLIEIMVVLVIIGLLMSIVGPKVMGVLGQGYKQKTRADLKNFQSALKMYKVENFTYPTTEQGLDALVNKPSTSPEPRNYPQGGYMDSIPKDAFGNDYQYLSPADSHPYDIYTLGADGLAGGVDENADVSVWDEVN